MDRALRDAVRRSMSLAHLRTSPKLLSASKIRKSFLDYFCEDNNHTFIRSSPVFSLKDPTLAFTNAGMNQFKDVFLDIVQPVSNRVANSQKCIRCGGLHNDLEQVGQDGSHHTFFEMLGNWSFGDYFKEEACRLAWNLLTEVYGIPQERLYVTYFGGDEGLRLGADSEVKEIWRQIGVKDSHILAFGAEENFWSGSPTGPCGTCTEIHYDHCPGRKDAGHLVNSGSNEVTELWNLVFTQFDRKSTGELTNLRKRFVDTGMGFERLVSVLQGKTSNYDTDLFLPLLEAISKHTGHPGYTGNYVGKAEDYGYRVLADHCRMITVSLSDGMLPNHAYRLRTLIRRTLSVAEKMFNARGDLLKELTSRVAETLSDAYPETEKHLSKVHYIIEKEEEIWISKTKDTLNRWKKMKNSYPTINDSDVKETPQILACLKYLRNNKSQLLKTLSNEDVYFLRHTLGVPVEVAADVAQKLGLEFDMESFLEYESNRKRVMKNVTHEKYLKERTQFSDVLSGLTERKIQPTTDYFKYDYRVDSSGKYIFKEQDTTIEAIVRGNEILDEISPEDVTENEEIGFVLDRTQLFCEEGGQASDLGTLVIEKEIIFDITRLAKEKNFIVHFGRFRNFPSDAKVRVQNLGVIKLDEDRRLAIMRNHTAVHLLMAALQEEIEIVLERSSAVNPDVLDLSIKVYTTNLCSVDDLKKVEKFVKDFILHGASVKRKILTHSRFQAEDDIVFIPGETILEREIPVIEINAGFKMSKQYCTGTHVLNASDLKDFVILKYVKGSYGVTHITAAAGEMCLKVREVDAEMQEMWASLKKEIAKAVHYSPSEDLSLKIKKFFMELSKNRETSSVTRTAIKDAVVEANKTLNSCHEISVRNFLEEELRKAFEESSEMFVVQCLECCWKFNPTYLETAAECFQDKPILMLLKGEGSVAVQCIVPANFVSRTFSAKNWVIESVLPVTAGLGKSGEQKNSDLTYFTETGELKEDQLLMIQSRAVELAKKNVQGFM